ncbi:MAG: glycosyltransferase family 39 protein [Elusimicrobium sp.]|jgi:4-amino-4-deoxy-L-arabinose transferase-like glycosyltransferase|nr:glycosyltransferase family 39 protein [Elusimicrobium sp.]
MQKIKAFIADKKNTKYFIFAALFVLYFWGLGSYNLINHDEGRYAEIPREMIARADFVTPTLNYFLYFEKPALHYWQTAAAFMVFGQNEFAARFFPCLLGLLGVFFTWLFAKKTYDEATANMSAVVLGTGVLYYAVSHINVTDMTVSFYLALSLFAFYFYFKENNKIWGLVFFGAMALAVLAKGLIGVVLPAGVIFWFMVFTRRWDIFKKSFWPAGILFFLAIVTPWFYFVCKANPDFFRFFFIQEHFLRYTTKMHGRYEPFWFFIPVVIGGVFPWTAGMFLSFKNMFVKREDVIFLSCWFFVMMLFFSISDSKLIPYIVPALPPLAVITAKNIMDALRANSKAKIAALLIFQTVITLALAVAAILILGRFIKINKIDDVLLYKNTIITLTVLCCVFTASGFYLHKKPAAFTAAMCVFAVLFLFFAKPGFVTIAKERSSKIAAAAMLKYLKPQDKVVIFNYYFQDMPFYLKRRVIITGWRGELEYGYSNAKDLDDWYIPRGSEQKLLSMPLEAGQKMYIVVEDDKMRDYSFKNTTKFVEKAGTYNIYVRE